MSHLSISKSRARRLVPRARLLVGLATQCFAETPQFEGVFLTGHGRAWVSIAVLAVVR